MLHMLIWQCMCFTTEVLIAKVTSSACIKKPCKLWELLSQITTSSAVRTTAAHANELSGAANHANEEQCCSHIPALSSSSRVTRPQQP